MGEAPTHPAPPPRPASGAPPGKGEFRYLRATREASRKQGASTRGAYGGIGYSTRSYDANVVVPSYDFVESGFDNLVHPNAVPEGAVPMTRVAVIDDQGIFRGGLCDILGSTPDLDLVGDSSEPGQTPPETDVLVVAEMSGRWTQVVTDLFAPMKSSTVVLILDVTDDATLERARELGVASCVPRSASPEAFVRAITHAVRVAKPTLEAAPRPPSGAHLPDAQQSGRLQTPMERSEASRDDGDAQALSDGTAGVDGGLGSPLGARDVEILASVAAGFSNRQVGDRLGLSDQTVKNRLTSILRKLGAVDRTEAVVTAIRHRWLPLEIIPTREAVSEYAG